jgi:hypothetical protein
MSEDKETVDSREKFREALEKKKQGNSIRNNHTAGRSKEVSSGQAAGNTPKMFRRKSGSA